MLATGFSKVSNDTLGVYPGIGVDGAVACSGEIVEVPVDRAGDGSGSTGSEGDDEPECLSADLSVGGEVMGVLNERDCVM